MDLKARILQFTTQPVEHPTKEIGTVYIRRMTLGEVDAMQRDSRVAPKDGEVPIPATVRLLARFIGDDKGVPLFDLAKPEDVAALMGFPVALAAELLTAGNTVNRLGGDEKNA
jgi:hypothetical protein